MSVTNWKGFDQLDEAVNEFRSGSFVIVCDDQGRQNEGDLVCAAEHATPEMINFLVTYARGLVCMPMTNQRAELLDLPLMVADNSEAQQPSFTVSIDATAKSGVTTGTSSFDRSRTIRLAASADAVAEDFTRPGHVLPLIAKSGGVLERAGHTEAAIELTKIAGLSPVAVICEILDCDGQMARLPQLMAFARRHGFKIIHMDQIIENRFNETGNVKIGERLYDQNLRRWSRRERHELRSVGKPV